MHPAIFLKVNLGVVIRVEKLSKGAELELFRDFPNHDYLVILDCFDLAAPSIRFSNVC